MAREPKMLSDAIRARQRRRQEAQRKLPAWEGRPGRRKADLPLAKRFETLPAGVSKRLRSIFEDRANLAARIKAKKGSLTVRQQHVLDRLRRSFDDMRPRHGRTEKMLASDTDIKKDCEDFARAARAADKVGLLIHPSVQADKAVQAAQGWLPSLRHDRQSLRRIKPAEKRASNWRLWVQRGKWFAKRAEELVADGFSHKEIRRTLVSELRQQSTKDATEFADLLEALGKSALSKRLQSLG